MIRLLHLSDLHFGALDPHAAETLPAYLHEVARGAAAVLVSGDLTQRARPWQFREARRYLDTLSEHLGCPWLAVPGNHDVPLWAVWERLACPLRRYRACIGAEGFVWHTTGLRVLGVNTARRFVPVLRGFWKDGRLDALQLAPLQNWPPPGAEPRTLRVVVAHHPLAAPDVDRRGDGVALGASAAIPLLARANVHLVLGGHLHLPYVRRLADTADGVGLWSVQAGTATSWRARPARDASAGRVRRCAFNVVGVTPAGELTVEVHGRELPPAGGERTAWGLAERRILGVFRGPP